MKRLTKEISVLDDEEFLKIRLQFDHVF